MSKTSVEAVNAKEATNKEFVNRGQPMTSRLQKWRRPKTADKGFQQQDWGRRHLRKGLPRGSLCCHFGKIKFIKYIAIAIFDIWCGFVFAIGMGLFNSQT